MLSSKDKEKDSYLEGETDAKGDSKAKGGKKFPKTKQDVLRLLRESLKHGQHNEEYPPAGADLVGTLLYEAIITDTAEGRFNFKMTHYMYMARSITNVNFGAQKTRYMDDSEDWAEQGTRIGDFKTLTRRQREQYVHIDLATEGSEKRIGSYTPPRTMHEFAECFSNFNYVCGIYYGCILPFFNNMGLAKLMQLNFQDDDVFDVGELSDFVDSLWQHWCHQLDRLTREPKRFRFSEAELQNSSMYKFAPIPLMLCDGDDPHYSRNLILSVAREEQDVLRAQVLKARAASRNTGGSQRAAMKPHKRTNNTFGKRKTRFNHRNQARGIESEDKDAGEDEPAEWLSIEQPDVPALQMSDFEASGTEPTEWDEHWGEWLECGAALEEMLLWDCSWYEPPDCGRLIRCR